MSEPKLIIDSDWKSQAQAEKERLATQTASKKPPATGEGGEGAPDEDREFGFEDIVGFFATQSLSYLGYIPDPYSGKAVVSLEHAKLYIDMLGVLEAKTKGNLSETENTGLTKTLSELRMAFVETGKAVAKAVQEGRLKPQQAPGVGMPPGGPMAGPGLVTPS